MNISAAAELLAEHDIGQYIDLLHYEWHALIQIIDYRKLLFKRESFL